MNHDNWMKDWLIEPFKHLENLRDNLGKIEGVNDGLGLRRRG